MQSVLKYEVYQLVKILERKEILEKDLSFDSFDEAHEAIVEYGEELIGYTILPLIRVY